MEWIVFLVFPAFTIGTIALGIVLNAMKQLKRLEERMEELESKMKKIVSKN